MSETNNNPTVTMKTNRGTIRMELFADKAPISTENFLAYAREGFYAGTLFHRVIPGFMIQGGGLVADLSSKKTRAPIKNEATNGLLNVRGSIAMARTSVVDSATSQFFINLDDNDFLDHKSPSPQGFGYAVFGRVIEGMDTVDAIAAVSTGRKGGHEDVPKVAVVIDSVTIDE